MSSKPAPTERLLRWFTCCRGCTTVGDLIAAGSAGFASTSTYGRSCPRMRLQGLPPPPLLPLMCLPWAPAVLSAARAALRCLLSLSFARPLAVPRLPLAAGSGGGSWVPNFSARFRRRSASASAAALGAAAPPAAACLGCAGIDAACCGGETEP